MINVLLSFLNDIVDNSYVVLTSGAIVSNFIGLNLFASIQAYCFFEPMHFFLSHSYYSYNLFLTICTKRTIW